MAKSFTPEEPTRAITKSTYTQHRRGAIVWIHNKVQPGQSEDHHQTEWGKWVDQVAVGTAGMKDAAVVGEISPEVASWLKSNQGINPATLDVVATRQKVQHALGESKASRGAGVSIEDIKAMPQILSHPLAVLWDSEDPALVYVFGRGGDRRGKFIVRINFHEKGMGTLNSFRTAGTAESGNLQSDRYKKIRGNP